MSIIQVFLSELDLESKSTIRILDRVPADRLEWTPHPKSMSLGRLAFHIANIPAICGRMVKAGKFDVSDARPPVMPADGATPVETYRRNLDEFRSLLETFDDGRARTAFTLVRGDTVLMEVTTAGIIRSIGLNHAYHHRGQLSVYLRLLDVPVPALYGTSADENAFG